MKLDEFLTIHQNFLPKISSQYGTGTVSLIFYSSIFFQCHVAAINTLR